MIPQLLLSLYFFPIDGPLQREVETIPHDI